MAACLVAPCGGNFAIGGMKSHPQRGDHRQPVGEDHGKRGPLEAGRRQVGRYNRGGAAGSALRYL